MFEGNWKCSGCDVIITELPFQPRSEVGLLCRECHSKQRGSGGGKPANNGERKMYSGEWPCSECDVTITELPFEPRSTENLKCRECFQKSRG